MEGATHLHLLALELASTGVSDEVATDKLVAEAQDHDEQLLASLMEANRVLSRKQATAQDRRAAMLLRLALLETQGLPRAQMKGNGPTRYEVTWAAGEPRGFTDELYIDLGRLHAAADEEPARRRRTLIRR